MPPSFSRQPATAAQHPLDDLVVLDGLQHVFGARILFRHKAGGLLLACDFDLPGARFRRQPVCRPGGRIGGRLA